MFFRNTSKHTTPSKRNPKHSRRRKNYRNLENNHKLWRNKGELKYNYGVKKDGDTEFDKEQKGYELHYKPPMLEATE